MGTAERIIDDLAAAKMRPNQLNRKAAFQSFLDGVVIAERTAAIARSANLGQPIPIWGLAAACVEGEARILEYELSGDSLLARVLPRSRKRSADRLRGVSNPRWT